MTFLPSDSIPPCTRLSLLSLFFFFSFSLSRPNCCASRRETKCCCGYDSCCCLCHVSYFLLLLSDPKTPSERRKSDQVLNEWRKLRQVNEYEDDDTIEPHYNQPTTNQPTYNNNTNYKLPLQMTYINDRVIPARRISYCTYEENCSNKERILRKGPLFRSPVVTSKPW